MQSERARSEDASTPADAQQAVPASCGAAKADSGVSDPLAADPVLHTLEGLLQRTRAARRFSLDFPPPVHRHSGAFRASSSEGLRSVSTLSTPGDGGGGPSRPGSRASVEGGASESDAAPAGPRRQPHEQPCAR